MTILRIIVAVLLGLIIGSAVNMGLILIGGNLIPPPDGVDVTNADSIASAAHLFEAKHFLFPFLAHAGGTLVGAICASLVAGSHRHAVAYAIGTLFFAGGIAAALMIPAPPWCLVTDLLLGYFPMAFIATKIADYFQS